MQLKLDELEIFNFGIFRGSTKLDFRGREIIGVLAEYDSDETRSNRAGKSLILESIKYNLVGTVRAKREVSMIHNGMEFMYVKCTYSDSDGKTYTIKRGRNLKGDGMLELDWVEKTRESQKAITDIFGVSAVDFELTHFFKQSDINGFMDLPPAEKTKYLMTWFDNGHWEGINGDIKNDLKDYRIKLKENEAVRKSLELASVVPEELEIDLVLVKRQKKSQETLLDDIESDLLQLDTEYHDLDKANSLREMRVKEVEGEIERARKNNDRISSLKTKLLAYERNLTLVDADLSKFEEMATVKEIREDITETKIDLNIQKSQRATLEKSNGICPILNTSCDSIQVDPAKIDNGIAVLISDLETLKSLEKRALEKQELEDEFDDIENDIGELQEKINNLTEVSLQPLAERLVELNDSSNDDKLFELDENIIALKTDKKNTSASINGFVRRIAGLEEKLGTAKEAGDKMIHLESKNEKIRLVIEDLNYLAMATGKNGIPSEEIENAFGEIQDDINYLMKEVDINATISFSPDKQLTAWEDFCHCGHKFTKGFRGSACPECNELREKKRKEEISLKIIENGLESDFGLDSGGGKCFGPDVEILMFDGSRKIAKNIVIGDLIMGPDSQPRRVERLTSGIAPMYKVTPTKGKPFTCNGKHMLPLKTTSKSYKHLEGNIQVEDYMEQTNGFRQAMKMWRTGVDFSSKDATIDPYLVGLWLGDGFSHQNGICVCNHEPEIKKWLDGYCDKKGYGKRIEDGSGCINYFMTNDNRKDAQGLVDLKTVREMCLVKNGISQEKRKYVNKHFLTASRKSRLELLAGLLDADGHLHHGYFEILVKSNQLADGVVFLAQSLGFQATTRIKKTNSPMDKTHHLYYHRINISGNVSEIPTKVKKKIASERKQVKNLLRVGFTVEQIDAGEYYGFEVSGNDHLIMLGDFTVSHNCIISFCVRVALTMLKKRQNKSKLNMIFLDEVDSALDKHFWSAIIDVITRILTRVLGYDQILMISHKEEIKNAIPNIIKVVRYSDYSKADFV